MVLQWPIDGAEAAAISMKFLVVDATGGQLLACFPHDRAGAGAFAFPPTVQHRPTGQDDCRDIHRCRRHEAGRRCLVATGHQHHAVERIAVEDFHQRQIGEVAVECRRSGACRFPGSDARGIRARCRRPSRMPSRTRLARSRWWRLQGERSEPVWAMPMIGLPDLQFRRRQAQNSDSARDRARSCRGFLDCRTKAVTAADETIYA